ncbi:Protein OS-9 [Actinomortierella ambigua]|nr:Protein OS-9 [Actinomortierella ambigua]
MRCLTAGIATLLVSLITLGSTAFGLSSSFVYNDLLSHPQYQLHFTRDPIPQSSVNSKVLRFGNDHHNKLPTKHQTKQESIEGDVPNDQVDENDLWSKGSKMIMTSSDGQRWACDIPESVEETTTTDPIKLSTADLEKEESRLVQQGLELLHKTKDACVFLTTPRGYWTYEFCYNNKIEQYHLAQEGKKIVKDGATYTLARYKSDTDSPADSLVNAAQKSLQKPSKSSPSTRTVIQEGSDRKQLVQQWSDGTVCDLTKKPRKATVYYQCELGLSKDEITMVNEPATCVYTITISSPRLCQEPAFVPVPQPEPAIVECRPVVSDEEHRRYLLHKSIDASAPDSSAVGEGRVDTQSLPPPELPQPPHGPPVSTLAQGAKGAKVEADLPEENEGTSEKPEEAKRGDALENKMSPHEKELLKSLFELYFKSLGITFDELLEAFDKWYDVLEMLPQGEAIGLDVINLGALAKKKEKEEEVEESS